MLLELGAGAIVVLGIAVAAFALRMIWRLSAIYFTVAHRSRQLARRSREQQSLRSHLLDAGFSTAEVDDAVAATEPVAPKRESGERE